MIYFLPRTHRVADISGMPRHPFAPPPVKAGEYALREPSEAAAPWETGFESPNVDALAGPLDTPVTFEEAELEDLLDPDVWSWPISVKYGRDDESDRGLLAILRYFGRPVHKLIQSETSRAVERLWGGKFQRRTGYVVADSSWTSTGRYARDFFLATWRELSDIHRDLASKRALMRAVRIRVMPNSVPAAETGSAAAIAKRMNPLGAPPHLV